MAAGDGQTDAPPGQRPVVEGVGGDVPGQVVDADERESPSASAYAFAAAIPTVSAEAVNEYFGSFEGFHGQLSAAAPSSRARAGASSPTSQPRGGSSSSRYGKVAQTSVPLLAFDAWEHAHYLQYKNVRPDFVKAMWEVVNWQDVAARYAAAKNA